MIRYSCQFRVFENTRVSAEVESVAAGRDSGGNDNTSLRRQRSRRPNDVQDAADGQTETWLRGNLAFPPRTGPKLNQAHHQPYYMAPRVAWDCSKTTLRASS